MDDVMQPDEGVGPRGKGDTDDVHVEFDFERIVGERLRLIRRQKRLSLHDVEQLSGKEFKASVLGAYERGERSLSVPRLARLAAIYRIPVAQLLPDTSSNNGRGGEATGADVDSKIRIDLARLESMKGPEAEMITRYVNKIQVQRQDFNGRVLTIRGDDLRLIACILGVSDGRVRNELIAMGLHMSGGSRSGNAG